MHTPSRTDDLIDNALIFLYCLGLSVCLTGLLCSWGDHVREQLAHEQQAARFHHTSR